MFGQTAGMYNFFWSSLAMGAVWLLWQIFVEVLSIRLMMNHDRRISNEVHTFYG
jgi:hypothetical protein